MEDLLLEMTPAIIAINKNILEEEMNRTIGLFCSLLFLSVTSIIHSQQASIYASHQIITRCIQATQSDTNTAMETATRAERQYKQQKSYREAANLYRQAVSRLPKGAWYFDLGNCLYYLGEFEESMKAFSAAAFLNYKDAHFAYYNAACTASLIGEEDNGYYYLGLAFRSGFSPESHAYSDSDLAHLRESKMFAVVIDEARSADVISINELWGQWIDEPMVADQMPGNYNFCPDGSYSYIPAETHPNAPKPDFTPIAYNGTYRVEEGFLYLTVDEAPGITLRISLNEPYYDASSNMVEVKLDQTPYYTNGPPRPPYCEPFQG